MKYQLNIIYLLIALRLAECYESYISGGSFVKYREYPHMVFLDISCRVRCVCGGSIVNQYLVMTAGHCTYECADGRIVVKYGHENIYAMKSTMMKRYLLHEDYDEEQLHNDISLIMVTQKIDLNKNVKRVILMKYPPLEKYGSVAGWGADETGTLMTMLKNARVEIQNPKTCTLINADRSRLHSGAMCAGPITGLGSALGGDSGGALVVDDYIQVGIVSFKGARFSLVAYTNISFYLNWIKRNSKRLFCYKKNK